MQSEIAQSVQATIGRENIEFLIHERKPNGIPDTLREASVPLNILPSYPALPPVSFLPDYAYYYIAFWFPGYRCWVVFDYRSHQEQCSGPYENDIDDHPYIYPGLPAPTHQEVVEALEQDKLVQRVIDRRALAFHSA